MGIFKGSGVYMVPPSEVKLLLAAGGKETRVQNGGTEFVPAITLDGACYIVDGSITGTINALRPTYEPLFIVDDDVIPSEETRDRVLTWYKQRAQSLPPSPPPTEASPPPAQQ